MSKTYSLTIVVSNGNKQINYGYSNGQSVIFKLTVATKPSTNQKSTRRSCKKGPYINCSFKLFLQCSCHASRWSERPKCREINEAGGWRTKKCLLNSRNEGTSTAHNKASSLRRKQSSQKDKNKNTKVKYKTVTKPRGETLVWPRRRKTVQNICRERWLIKENSSVATMLPECLDLNLWRQSSSGIYMIRVNYLQRICIMFKETENK